MRNLFPLLFAQQSNSRADTKRIHIVQRTMTRTLVLSLLLTLTACDQKPPLHDLNGNPITLTNNNKTILINYWASWCAPCMKEIPELNAFQKAYDDVIVMGVSFDLQKGDALKAIVKKVGIEYTVLQEDPAAHIGIDKVPGLPATYLLDKQGHIKETLFGPQTKRSLEQWL